jgi:phosphoribosylglycinamide formyltransferase-1
MSTYRVAVLASGAGTNLQALLDTVNGRDGVEIVAVGSNREGVQALDRARAAGIETGVYPAGAFAGRTARDGEMARWLVERKVDLVVLAGYMELLDSSFLDAFEQRVINVHPALLPAFPGLAAVEQALAYGVKVFGVTVHFVDAGVDTGAVILQGALELPDARSPDDVLPRLHALEHELLPRAVRLLAAGRVRLDPERPRRVLVDE